MKRLGLSLALLVSGAAVANPYLANDYWREICNNIDDNGDGIVDNNYGGGRDSLTIDYPTSSGIRTDRCVNGKWQGVGIDTQSWSGALEPEVGGLRQWAKIHCGGQGRTCPHLPDYLHGNYSSSTVEASPAAEGSCPDTAGVGCRWSIDDHAIYKDWWPATWSWTSATRPQTLRLRVERGDNIPGMSADRSMLAILREGDKVEYVEGDARYYSFEVYFPSGTRQVREKFPDPLPWSVNPINAWHVLFQGHQTGSCGGSPPWSLGLGRTLDAHGSAKGSQYRLLLDWTSHPNATAVTHLYASDADPLDNAGLIQKDRWIRVTLYVKHSSHPTVGEFILWVNGVEVLRKQTNTMWAPVAGCDGGPTIISLGLYRDAGIVEPETIFYRGFMSSTHRRPEFAIPQ